MHVAELLKNLNDRGIYLHVDGGKLKSRSGSADIAPELAQQIRARREELIVFLSANDGSFTPAATIPRRPANEAAPLSFGQRRLWLVDQIEGGSAQYNMPAAFRLSGALDTSALQRALDAVVARHEVLRTTYVGSGDEAQQIIHAQGTLSLQWRDLSALATDAQESAVRAAVDAEAVRVFDLQHEVPLRVIVLVLSADEHVVVFTMHHIAADGWSLGVLVREFVQAYVAASAGHSPAWTPLAIQYADYAHWQRSETQQAVLDQQLSYWRDQLTGLPRVHSLPLDFARPPQASYVAESVEVEVDAVLLQSVKALAQSQEATLFMVLQAAYALLLSRWSGEDDVVMGVPIAGRTRPEVEPLIGFFINTLVFRSTVSPSTTVSQWIAQARQTALQAYAHQELPFELLIDALQPERDLAYNPLCQVKFILQNYESQELELPGLRLTPLAAQSQQIRFDLDLTVTEREGVLGLNFSYKTSLFADATIRRFADAYVQLLRGMVAAPTAVLAELPLLAPESAQQMRALGQGDVVAEGREVCLADAIRAAAANHGEAIAVRDASGRSITHAQLDAQSNRLAHYLIEQGVGAGQFVGIVVERSVELIIGLLAIQKTGAAYVPLDARQGKARVAEILSDAQIDWVLASSAKGGELPVGGIDLVFTDGIADASDWLADYPASAPEVVLKGDDAVYAIYTSGSTGKPKGVLIKQSGLMDYCAFARQYYYADALDGSLVVTSAAFDLTVPSLYVPLLVGGCVELLADEGELEGLAATLAAGEKNYLLRMTPGHVQGLLVLLPNDANVAANHHVFVIGGEAFTPALATQLQQRFANSTIYNHYGPTETVVGCALHRVDIERDAALLRLPIGRAMHNTRLYVLDAARQPVPVGVAGELHIGGAGVAIGYLHREELTAEKFVTDPFVENERVYRTGDLVRWRADGELEFLGRADDQVKLRGFRIELGEIESRLRQLDGVSEAVVRVRGEDDAQQLVAYVVPQGNTAADWSDTLRSALQSQLPDYMVPTAWCVLDQLPRTPNGKLDNRALPEPGKAAADAYVEPATSTEQAVAETWSTLLKRESVSATANFFALGGNSLLATRVVSAVAERLHKRVAVRSVFEHATVRAFAKHIDEQATTIHKPIPVVARDTDLPLSFAQQRLWFIDELEGGSPQYNMPVAVRLRGKLDELALQTALDTLVARHEVLRTTYVTQGEQAVQRIAPIAPVAIRHVHTDTALDEAALEAFIATEARQAFQLGTEAPLRVSLLTLAANDHVVLFTLHHIASDGWSMGLVIDEFVSAYEAAVGKTTPRLPVLPVQYADYAQWQRERLQGDALEQTLSYWRTQLAGIPAVHSLPLDHARPAQQQFSGARLARHVDLSTKQRVDKLSREENATPFMLLQAVFALLLGRWSGEDDIVIGTPVAGRTHRDLERLVGFFVNTLVLRTDLSGDPSFRSLLAQSRTSALAAQQHQELPFEMLVDALQPTRSLSHTPVFQIMFSLRNHVQGRRALSLPGLAVELVNPTSDSVKFDLELVVTETDTGLALDWIYATSLFDAATIARFAQAFERVLAAVLADPDRSVQRLELVGDAEREPVLQLGDAARRAGLVTQVFDAHVRAAPDAAAVECGDVRLSYAALDARANQVAHVLRARGLRADDVVAICFERSVDSVVALLGVLKAGAAYLPLDPAYPPDRLRYMLDDSRAVCVLTHRAAAAAVPHGDAPLLLLDDAAFAAAPTTAPVLDPHAGGLQLAYLIYTSGSSGKPKGVMVHHAGALNLARNLDRLFGAGDNDRVLQFASISFDAAVWDWLLALSRGACLSICPADVRQSPEQLADYLVTQRITHATLPPALLPHLDPARDYALRALIVAGEACDAHSAWRWASRVPLYNAYGPTETSVCATIARVVPQQRITIGNALENFELRVLSRAGIEQPVGVAGELQIGGIGVARGYLGRSELTAAAFEHDVHDPAVRRYRTGDLVRRLADGAFEFLGRIDEQVKLRGFRIELGEIEWQLRQCAGVKDVAVLVRGDDGAKRLVAYVVADAAAASPQTLSRAVRAQLPEHMVPSAYVFLDALPLTTNGKLDKRALPEPPAPVADASSAPRNATERALCEIWQRLLRVPQVGIHDNFFAIGGDSILSTQVVARANQAGLRLTTRQMFEHQTIAELAEVVEGAHAAQAPQHAQTGALLLTPVQRRFFAESAIEVDHYNQAVLLTTPADFDGACLPHLARALYERHDALRLAFTHTHGEWTAQHRALTLAMIEDTVAIERLPDDEEGDARCLAERGQHWQRSLDIAQARLWRLVHFEGKGRSGRLLIVVHHLVVDGVSWRVMLADLERAYRQYASGADVHLAAKTNAFAQWGEALRGLANDADLQAQRDFWLARYAVPVAALPQDLITDTTPALATTERINLSLSDADTRALLQRCGAVYRTQINELLLAGVYLGLQRWTGKHGVRVALEGHGREPLFDDLDVTETVGWFTTLYPLTLQADSVLPGDVIKAVKEQYRAVPGHGIGYGLLRHGAGDAELAAAEAAHGPQLVFNYLGQFDQSINAETLFQAADEYAGDKISAARPRPFLLGLSGRVLAGHLRLSLDYSNAQYRRATVKALAECIEWGLQSVIHHCLSPQAGAYTPSDFPLASVSQQRLDVWQQRYPQLARLYPATAMQQGLLFESRNDRSAYVTQTYPLLRGRLDLALFRRAWDSVIARHDIFRTVFVGEDAELHQLVLQSADLPWQEHDWRDLDADTQRERFAAFRRDDKQAGFDFAQAPLMRIAVFQLDDERHQLLWTHHHMLVDGWCLPLVYREVMQVYDGLVEGRAPRLAAAPLYEHYMSWLARQSEARAENYWRERLAGIESTTSLSIDRLQRDPQAPREIREQILAFDAAETARLQEWTRERRTTLNTVLQLAWAYLLHRYSNESTVAFGTIIAGRPAEVPGIEDMIGLFINTLPVVVDFSGDASTDALLSRVQQDFQRSQEFAPLSLARIQRLAPLPPGMALFDSLFVFENYPVDSALEGQRAQHLQVEQNTNDSQTSYPLTVIATLVHQLKLKCAYRADRFTDGSMTRLLGHLRRILLALTEAKTAVDLRAIDPIADDERTQLLTWAQPAGARIDAPAIPLWFDEQVQAAPDAIALTGDDGSLTYRELDRRANRLAHWLRTHGAGTDVLIGLALPRSMDMTIAMLAVLKAGAAYVPLDPDYPAARLDYMRADSGVGIVLSRSDVGANLAAAGAQFIDADDFVATLAALPDTAPALPADHGPRSLAYVMYTSGSTGQPKGVQVEHSSVVRLVKSPNYLKLDRETVFLQLASTAFDAATLEIWGALLNGGRVAFYPPGPADIAVLNRCLAQYRVNTVFLTIGLFEQWSSALPADHALRYVMTGGDVISPRVLQRVVQGLPSTQIIACYGPTENTTYSTCHWLTRDDALTSVPLGRPINGTQVRVLSARRQLQPIGATGELFLGGAGLARGYLRRPELSAQRFVADVEDSDATWYRTGDLVRMLEDGTLDFVGRADDQIKLRGFRIELGEIEAQLRELPQLRDVAVIVRGEGNDKQVVAYVVADEAFDEIELRATLLRRLPAYMVPSAFVVLDVLPLTVNGKLDRARLPVPEQRAHVFVAASTPTEAALAEIWQAALKSGPVSVDANFFALGGHSLTAMKVVSAIAAQLGASLGIRDLFTYQTIADLARFLDALAAETPVGAARTDEEREEMEW